MNLPIINCQQSTLHQFIEFWSGFYSYDKEYIYDDCISKQTLSKDDIQALFIWKNGMKLSGAKHKSLEEKIISRLDAINFLKSQSSINPADLNIKFQDVTFVWRAYLMHIIRPNEIPIYDQNVHRAYNYMHGIDYLSTSEYLNDRIKERFYFEEYSPFIRSINGLTLRKIDRALFAFGQFLKNQTYSNMLK